MTDPTLTDDDLQLFALLLGAPDLAAALKDGRRFQWFPQDGITTEELATCLTLAVLVITESRFEIWARIYDVMPPNCQRHFRVINNQSEAAND